MSRHYLLAAVVLACTFCAVSPREACAAHPLDELLKLVEAREAEIDEFQESRDNYPDKYSAQMEQVQTWLREWNLMEEDQTFGDLIDGQGMLLSVPLAMTAKIALEADDETRWIAMLMASGSRLRAAQRREQSKEKRKLKNAKR